jgi:hypothetical protein
MKCPYFNDRYSVALTPEKDTPYAVVNREYNVVEFRAEDLPTAIKVAYAFNYTIEKFFEDAVGAIEEDLEEEEPEFAIYRGKLNS